MKISDLTTQGSNSFGINSLIQQTQPSTFRRILGGVVGGAANMVAPGLGSLVGGAIGGTGGGLFGGGSTGIGGALSTDPMFFLQLQQQMEQEQRTFEAASNVLKSRHDAAMAAVQNIR